MKPPIGLARSQLPARSGARSTSRFSLLLVVMVSACAAPPPGSVPTQSASPAAVASPDGLSREEAVDAALEAVGPLAEDWTVTEAQVGAIGRIRPGWQDEEWGQELPGDLPVWRVALAAGELGAEVIIDVADGTVYSSIVGIAN